MKQTIDCEYTRGNWALQPGAYDCKIRNQIIVDSKHSQYEFRGNHRPGMTNNQVMAINFISCTISRIPQGLTQTFPNARFLQLWNCKLKSVEREDLMEYSKFTDLTLVFNDIPILRGDLLSDMKDLIGVWLHHNKTQVIEPNLLDGLENLVVVDLSKNWCIDKRFDLLQSKGNTSLEELKRDLESIYMNSPWRAMLEKTKQLEQEIERLERKSENTPVADDLLRIGQFHR
jgi:hypothetical protein